jgi:cytoskeletal protein RodZ
MTNASWWTRQVARFLILWMAAPFGWHFARAQEAPSSNPAPQSSTTQTPDNPVPQKQSADSAGQGSQGGATYPDAPQAQSSPPDNGQSGSQPKGDQEPLGVAAAPFTRPSGVTGSRPAGAVIAPAKQRRVRTILISVGVIVAAGIAVGTVAALSHASPSHAN